MAQWFLLLPPVLSLPIRTNFKVDRCDCEWLGKHHYTALAEGRAISASWICYKTATLGLGADNRHSNASLVGVPYCKHIGSPWLIHWVTSYNLETWRGPLCFLAYRAITPVRRGLVSFLKHWLILKPCGIQALAPQLLFIPLCQ